MIPRLRVAASNLQTRPRVLVPVLMGQMARPIISVGDALATPSGASGNVLALVELRSGRDDQIFDQEQRRRDMLLWIAGLEYGNEVRRRLIVTLRVTANVASSVRDAIAENETTSLVLEWPTVTSPRRHGLSDLTRQLLRDGSTEVIFVRAVREAQSQAVAPRSILAAIRGGPSAREVAFKAAALADVFGSVLTLLHIRTGSRHPDRARREWQSFEEIVDELHRPATIVTVRRREDAAPAILEEAGAHDLVMIGSRMDPTRPDVLVRRDLQRMVRHLQQPVIMVRAKNQSRHEAPAARRNGHG